ncbi:3-hydroxyacyl-CoA dehydrogenase, NAD binding domain-containing protein [Ditylenchus destructor]|uniref:3-hydroxyacyl-CoA dehydrogenase, NAD binding domain-containing protein n=1 Tax=Ditylenchus destructor TaxID=166010 RepID=A0AAD4MFN2_9BILA|nr:3-hydroxyacyl-CoA dehydrogenase, NAD binding domain-containing protein [Ditylenchus destructor]
MAIQTVGIIGAGTMGNGIAQACAVAGVKVVMVGHRPGGGRQGPGHGVGQPRPPDQEGKAHRRAEDRRAGAHPGLDELRRPEGRPAGHRGRHREPRAQAQDPQAGRRDAGARGHHRLEHLLDLDHAAGRSHLARRPLHRHALLQPGADDGAGGADPRLPHERRHARHGEGAGRAPGQVADHGEERPGLRGQPHPGADDQRGLLRAVRRHRHGGRHRCRHEAGLQPAHRPAGAGRHDRPGRVPGGDGGVPGAVRRLQVPPLPAAEGNGRGRPVRPQDRPRRVHLLTPGLGHFVWPGHPLGKGATPAARQSRLRGVP